MATILNLDIFQRTIFPIFWNIIFPEIGIFYFKPTNYLSKLTTII